MTSLWDVLWLTASVVTLLNLWWRVMFRGHVNPFYPWGALTDVFVSNGDFSGGNMRRHRILDRLTPALWVSLRFCADLQHFGPIIWGVFDLPIVLICASVKLNLQGEISPPRCYSSRGCCGLPVILSLIEPFFFLLLIFGLPRARWPRLRWVISKAPHLDNIPVTVGTLTGANRLCDDSRSCRLTIKQRHTVVLQLF